MVSKEKRWDQYCSIKRKISLDNEANWRDQSSYQQRETNLVKTKRCGILAKKTVDYSINIKENSSKYNWMARKGEKHQKTRRRAV